MKFEESDRTVLCHRCASDFYNTGAFHIVRADRDQQETEICCYCGVRSGYDFFVRKKEEPPRRRKGR